MSLHVNGLRVHKNKENDLPRILELLKEPVIIALQEGAASKTKDFAASFYDYYEKDMSDESKNKNIISYSDFFAKKIHGLRKKFVNPSFFENTHNIETFPLFLEALLTCEMYSYDQYEIEIAKTNKTKRTLIILPSCLNQSSLPEELFEFCENYSTENQTDDLPSHFKVYAEKEEANSEWYDLNKTTFLHNVEIPLKIEEWLSEMKSRKLFTKINIAYTVYESHYLKDKKMDYYKQMDEIFLLMEQDGFNELINNEIKVQEKLLAPKLELLKEKWGVRNV